MLVSRRRIGTICTALVAVACMATAAQATPASESVPAEPDVVASIPSSAPERLPDRPAVVTPAPVAQPAAAAPPAAAPTAVREMSLMTLPVGRSRAVRSLAADAGLSPEGITIVTVSARSKRVCRARGATVRTLRPGLCRYTITTHSADGQPTGQASWAFIVRAA